MCCSGEITSCNCAPCIWFNRWANPAYWPSSVGVPHGGHDRSVPCVWHEPVHEHRHFHQLLHQQLYPWDWTWVTAPPAAACLIQNKLHWILVTVFHPLVFIRISDVSSCSLFLCCTVSPFFQRVQCFLFLDNLLQNCSKNTYLPQMC